MGILIKTSKLVPILDSPVFCDSCKIIDLLIFVYLGSFYKTKVTLLHVCFIIFDPAHTNPILLHQFINLLGRFDHHIFYSNAFLDQINSANFASYLAFYVAHQGPSTCPINQRLVLDPDSLRNICYQ